jgi:hypothetical protein
MPSARFLAIGAGLLLAITTIGTIFVAAEATTGHLDVSDLKIATSGAIIAILFIPPFMWKFKHTFKHEGTHHAH